MTSDLRRSARRVERILVLDGAMGTEIQASSSTRPAIAARASPTGRRTCAATTTCSILSAPDAIRDIHAAYFRAGADIVETNTFSSTAIAQADYGMRGAGLRAQSRGRAARARGRRASSRKEDGRPRFVAGALGPDQPHRLALARRQPTRAFAPSASMNCKRGLPRAGARAARRRRRSPAGRDDLRYAQRQGRALRHRRAVRRARRQTAGDDLRHHHRPLRPHAVGPDADRVLAFDPPRRAAVGRASTARSAPRRCAPISPRSRASPTRWSAPIRMPGCRTSSGSTTRARNTWPNCSASSPRPASSTSSAAAAARRPRTSARSRKAVAGKPPRPIPEVPRRLRLSGLEPFTLTPEIPFVNVGERTNVTGSAKLPQADHRRRLSGGARGRARPGRERRPDHRRQHGRGPARFRDRPWSSSCT